MLKPLNKKAQAVQARSQKDVKGYTFSDCCPSFAPGWEVGPSEDQPDPCPWRFDLRLCWQTCYWTGQVPDISQWNSWMNSCGNLNDDWRNLCVVPDLG
jgi:hypothetical protein